MKLVAEAGMLSEAPAPESGQTLRDLRREINETYRAQSRSEALRETVAEAAENAGSAAG